MKKALSLCVAVLFLLTSAEAQTTKWVLDKAHTTIGFNVAHMVISKVYGEFKEYDGTVLSDKEDFTDAKIEFTAKIASINTGVEKRDDDLRSENYFDAAKYPELSFKGTALKKISGNLYKLSGNLTIRNVTKPVELDVVYNGTIKDPWGNIRAGFEVKGVINRFDFGITNNSVIETGGLVVGKEVEIICNVEVLKQK